MGGGIGNVSSVDRVLISAPPDQRHRPIL